MQKTFPKSDLTYSAYCHNVLIKGGGGGGGGGEGNQHKENDTCPLLSFGPIDRLLLSLALAMAGNVPRKA